jgi:hypothetical protein
MIAKRAPLFIFGLLYGAIINSVVLGLAYGLYTAGKACKGIITYAWDAILLSMLDNVIIGLMAISLIMVVGACIGLVFGVGYGLVMGTWHCAMDFHNNGFMKGLTSPFRFLEAEWDRKIKDNPTKSKAYLKSVDVHFIEKKAKAAEEIIKRAHTVDALINKETIKFTNKPMPKDLTQIIAGFEITPDFLPLSNNSIERRVANHIESLTRPVDKVKAPADVKETQRIKNTAAEFYTPQEALKIIQRDYFFHDKSSQKKNKTPLVSVREDSINFSSLKTRPP